MHGIRNVCLIVPCAKVHGIRNVCLIVPCASEVHGIRNVCLKCMVLEMFVLLCLVL